MLCYETFTYVFMNFAPNKQLNVDGKDPSWVFKKKKKIIER